MRDKEPKGPRKLADTIVLFTEYAERNPKDIRDDADARAFYMGVLDTWHEQDIAEALQAIPHMHGMLHSYACKRILEDALSGAMADAVRDSAPDDDPATLGATASLVDDLLRASEENGDG